MLLQPSLPERYLNATEADLARAIAARKAELGSKLLILGHHYQQDDVIQHADLVGDSLKLSQMARPPHTPSPLHVQGQPDPALAKATS
ncbi:MAG: quinolinate synthase NadA [Prosthecobacter sp.]